MQNQFTCHLWAELPTRKDLQDSLSVLKTYEEDSHFIRRLERCKRCGQLYFYEFTEEVDWKKGNDAQYRIWIPVETEGQAEELSQCSSAQLRAYESLRVDFPSDKEEPTVPYKTK